MKKFPRKAVDISVENARTTLFAGNFSAILIKLKMLSETAKKYHLEYNYHWQNKEKSVPPVKPVVLIFAPKRL